MRERERESYQGNSLNPWEGKTISNCNALDGLGYGGNPSRAVYAVRVG